MTEPCHHRDEAPHAGRPVAALDAADLLVVGAFRAWVAPVRAPGAPAPDWRALLAHADLPENGAAAWGALLEGVGRAMRRPLDVRCCACPRVGSDEEAMLRVVAALQAGDRLGALDDLADWVGEEAAPRLLPAAGRFAAALAGEGLRPAGAATTAPTRPPPATATAH